jgi:hypothetical protein
MSIDVEAYDDFDDPYDDPSLDSQEQHDIMMFRRSKEGLEPGSKVRLEELLAAKVPRKKLTRKERVLHIVNVDPTEQAISDNPELTRKEDERMAKSFGF